MDFTTTRAGHCRRFILPPGVWVVCTLALLLGASPCIAQLRTGEWRNHLAHNQGIAITQVPDQWLSISAAGVLLPHQANAELVKAEGLTDFDITAAYYDTQSRHLVLGYRNGGIDLVQWTTLAQMQSGAYTRTITALRDEPLTHSKQINRWLRVGRNLYGATAFGIINIEVDKALIVEDFSIAPTGGILAVNDLVLHGQYLYAATDTGVYYVDKDHPQIFFFESWSTDLPTDRWTALASVGTTLYALNSQGQLWQHHSNTPWTPVPMAQSVQSLVGHQEAGWLTTTDSLYRIGTTQAWPLPGTGVQVADVWQDNNALYLLTTQHGLWHWEPEQGFVPWAINKPTHNQWVHMDTQGSQLACVGGGMLGLLTQHQWHSILHPTLATARRVRVHPTHPQQLVVGTGSQVLLFDQGALAWQHDVGGKVDAMEWDRDGALYVFVSRSSTPLHRMDASGQWTTLQAPILEGGTIGQVAYRNKMFWGVVDSTQLFAYAPTEGTGTWTLWRPRAKTYGDILSLTPTAIAATRDNQFWLGTDRGGIVSYTASNTIFGDEEVLGRRVTADSHIANLGAYLLSEEVVLSIAVDPGNRKWFGTQESGVFLQSPTGYDQERAFSISNSPLPYNSVPQVVCNVNTGEVFFISGGALVSYQSDATEAMPDFSSIKIFPNPVRPHMQLVNITGLTEDALIKIVDAAGILVYEGAARGGSFTWDLRRTGGQRVATGVYTVLALSTDGQTTGHARLLVVN